jgi:hypothetical protein
MAVAKRHVWRELKAGGGTLSKAYRRRCAIFGALKGWAAYRQSGENVQREGSGSFSAVGSSKWPHQRWQCASGAMALARQ